jgi:hypothetical protein
MKRAQETVQIDQNWANACSVMGLIRKVCMLAAILLVSSTRVTVVNPVGLGWGRTIGRLEVDAACKPSSGLIAERHQQVLFAELADMH